MGQNVLVFETALETQAVIIYSRNVALTVKPPAWIGSASPTAQISKAMESIYVMGHIVPERCPAPPIEAVPPKAKPLTGPLILSSP